MKFTLKIMIAIIAISSVLGIGFAFAKPAPTYNVKADNTNNNGYIFVGTGTTQGATEIGTWKDPTTISSLKGDKGDTGAQGIAGLNGLDGYTPIKGVDYFDGINGLNGLDGKDGKDVDPATVNNLKNADKKLNKRITKVNNNSIARDNILNDRINSNASQIQSVSKRVSALEATQYVVRGEVKFIRERHLEVGVYGEYNVGRSTCSEVGVAFTILVGKSYVDRELDAQNTRLTRLEQYLSSPDVQESITQAKMNKIEVVKVGNTMMIKK